MNSTTIRMAWRGLWRHPQRTLLMIAMVAFGSFVILFLWGVTDGFLTTMTRTQAVENQGAFQVRAVGYADDPASSNGLTPDDVAAAESALAGLRAQAVAPRLETYGMIRSAYGTDGVTIRGVDPLLEPRVTELHNTLTAGRYPSGTGEALLSAKLASDLDVRVGERAVLLASGENGTSSLAFRAVGFFSSTLTELDKVVLIPIADARRMTGWEGATALAVSLPPGASTDRAVSHARALLADRPSLEVADYFALNPLARVMIQGSTIKMIPFVILISLLVGFGVANTTFYSVLERTREFGVMAALGMSRRQLANMVLAESILVSSVGFAVGGSLGYGTLLYMSRVGLDLGSLVGVFSSDSGIPAVIYASASGLYWLAALSVVVFTALAAAWYPARRANRLEPVTAIREG
ncbi:MAG: ABC transporter permease [Candidatus Bipolaricaulota bacterium]|nr:ABC transporter permease [Candidatus Bipolaricaulota bacterium]